MILVLFICVLLSTRPPKTGSWCASGVDLYYLEEGERLGLGVTCLLTVLAVMFITNDTLPATRDFTLLSMFYLGSLCYTLMPLIGSAMVIALNNFGDTVMTRGKAHNKALETLWDIASELIEEEQAAEEAVVARAAMNRSAMSDEDEYGGDGGAEHSGLGGAITRGRTMIYRGFLEKAATSVFSAVKQASSRAGNLGSSVGSTISSVNPLSPMFKVLNHRYNVNEVLKVQLESFRCRVQKNTGFLPRAFRYGNEGEWPTYQEFAAFLDTAGAWVIPLSYFVFLMILNGAAVYNNYKALSVGMVVFTIIAVGAFFAVVLFQVQQCRHLKQLQNVIYSREGVSNDELDNDDIAQYRKDFMEFDKDFSGQIDLGELITAIESTGRRVQLLEFMRVLGMADQNLDRTISFSEFVNLFETAKLKREMLAKSKSRSPASKPSQPHHTSPSTPPTAKAAAEDGKEELDILKVREWDSNEVGRWLALEGFGPEVVKKFLEQGIDGDVLQTLTERDMKDDLGVARLADRRRLGEATRQLAQYDRYARVRDVMDMMQQHVPGDSIKDRSGGGGVKVNIPPGVVNKDLDEEQ